MKLTLTNLPRLFVMPLLIAMTSCASDRLVNANQHSGSTSAVPPEYIPSPGFCRIWYEDRLPEQQPAQGDCDSLQQNVPDNAVLLKS